MSTGLSPDSVEAAVKLLAAAKQMGVQRFKLGDFEVSFMGDAVDLNSPVRSPMPSAPPGANALFEDEDMWLHVKQQAPKV